MVDKNDLGRFRITKFNGNDFSLWKDKVINALTAVECNQAITEEFDLNQNRDVNLKKDEKVKLILMSAIHDDILRKISRKTAKDIWSGLQTRYEVRNIQQVISLRRKFFNSKQDKNETIESFIERVKSRR